MYSDADAGGVWCTWCCGDRNAAWALECRQASGSSGYGTNSGVSSLAGGLYGHGVDDWSKRRRMRCFATGCEDYCEDRERDTHTHTRTHTQAIGSAAQRDAVRGEGRRGWQRRMRASRCASPVFHHSSRSAREQLRTTIPACLIACYGESCFILPSYPSFAPAPIGRVPPCREHPRLYPGQSRMSAR